VATGTNIRQPKRGARLGMYARVRVSPKRSAAIRFRRRVLKSSETFGLGISPVACLIES
jgi:hypothetical protein